MPIVVKNQMVSRLYHRTTYTALVVLFHFEFSISTSGDYSILHRAYSPHTAHNHLFNKCRLINGYQDNPSVHYLRLLLIDRLLAGLYTIQTIELLVGLCCCAVTSTTPMSPMSRSKFISSTAEFGCCIRNLDVIVYIFHCCFPYRSSSTLIFRIHTPRKG